MEYIKTRQELYNEGFTEDYVEGYFKGAKEVLRDALIATAHDLLTEGKLTKNLYNLEGVLRDLNAWNESFDRNVALARVEELLEDWNNRNN